MLNDCDIAKGWNPENSVNRDSTDSEIFTLVCIYTADKHITVCGNWGQSSFTEPDRPVVFFHLTAFIIVC